MRVLLALLCLLPALCDAQAVARTGDNAIKIPLDVNNNRVTFVAGPTGGNGTLQMIETFDTPMAFPNFPYNAPYVSIWNSVGDPGCVRSVTNANAQGTYSAVFDFTPQDTGSNHCMIRDNGTGSNFQRGVVQWIGWEWYMSGAWAPNCTADGGVHPYCNISGGHDINFQMHSSGPAGENPPINFDAGNGPGNPWKIVIQAKDTTVVPTYNRSARYETCGNVILGQWDRWAIRVDDSSSASTGSVDIYRGSLTTPLTLCAHDTGLNDYPANAIGLYPTIGNYHGEGSRAGAPQGERIIIIDQYRRGRENTGVGLADVSPR